MAHKPDMFGATVIGIGKFNPAIISADWLERNGLIGREDAEAARQRTSMIVAHQVSQLETDWFAIQVVETQFSVASKGVVTGAIRDLAAGILGLLPQTPIDAIGVNFFGHFRMISEKDYHRIGDVFAPKSIWDELFPTSECHVGLADLTIAVHRKNAEGKVVATKDLRRISLQPSGSISNGVYLMVNDHRDLSNTDALAGRTPAERAAQIVDSEWEGIRTSAESLFDQLLSKALSLAESA
jgi:hypothetical protein